MADCIVRYRDVMTGEKNNDHGSRAGYLIKTASWRSRPEISGVHFVKPAWLDQPWSHMGLLSITIECAGQTHQIQDITPLGTMISPHCWLVTTGFYLRTSRAAKVNQMDIRSSAQFSSHKKQWSSCIFRSGYNCEEGGGRRGGLLTPYIIASLPDLISINFNV